MEVSSGHTGSAIGAMALPVGADFTLDKVPNFNKICVVAAGRLMQSNSNQSEFRQQQ